ncbi:hypothetical protein AB0I60_33210 [Actinosynnema sp. NPDC050436]|uniref:hypothetical protein n=1 Tax=Actinosynnema sp. NPDC050436 TaxID=3155659 RepID=UPI00340BCBE4
MREWWVRQVAKASGNSVVFQAGRDLVVKFQQSPRLRWGTWGVLLAVLTSLLYWSAAQPRWSYALPPGRFAPPVRTTTAPPVVTSAMTTEPVVPKVEPTTVVRAVPVEPAPVPPTTVAPAAAVPAAVVAGPAIVISRGAPTSSSKCEKGKCYWIDTRLTGFAANKPVSVEPIGNGRNFSDPCEAVTDASGAADCNDTRYDVPGAVVYVYVDTPQGRVESNRITWPS